MSNQKFLKLPASSSLTKILNLVYFNIIVGGVGVRECLPIPLLSLMVPSGYSGSGLVFCKNFSILIPPLLFVLTTASLQTL
jgi:hypothetical protein